MFLRIVSLSYKSELISQARFSGGFLSILSCNCAFTSENSDVPITLLRTNPKNAFCWNQIKLKHTELNKEKPQLDV